MDIASPPDASGEELSRTERIARRAYDLYLERGGLDGYDMNDWLQAEREIEDESVGEHRSN
jgi:hypothetical protein